MDKITVHYVRFYSPGSLRANDWTAEVQSADPAAVVWPENAYAFTLHERVDVLDGPERFEGKPQQIGPTYYHPDSKVMTEAQIAAKGDPRNSILLNNMRINKWPSVIYSRRGNWPQPYEADKVRVLGAA
jgi:hypothetical protein